MAAPDMMGAEDLAGQYFSDGFYPGGVKDDGNRFEPSNIFLKADIMVGARDMRGRETRTSSPRRSTTTALRGLAR